MSKFNPLDYTPRKDVFDEALFDTIIDEFSPKKIDKKRPVFEFDPNSPTEIITGSLLKIGQREVADWGSKFESKLSTSKPKIRHVPSRFQATKEKGAALFAVMASRPREDATIVDDEDTPSVSDNSDIIAVHKKWERVTVNSSKRGNAAYYHLFKEKSAAEEIESPVHVNRQGENGFESNSDSDDDHEYNVGEGSVDSMVSDLTLPKINSPEISRAAAAAAKLMPLNRSASFGRNIRAHSTRSRARDRRANKLNTTKTSSPSSSLGKSRYVLSKQHSGVVLPPLSIDQSSKYFGANSRVQFYNTYRDLYHIRHHLVGKESDFQGVIAKELPDLDQEIDDQSETWSWANSYFDDVSQSWKLHSDSASTIAGTVDSEYSVLGSRCSFDPSSPRAKYLSGCLESGMPPRCSILLRDKESTSLWLDHQGMGDRLGMLFALGLSDIPHVTSLNLSDNNLTDVSLTRIIQVVAQTYNITDLNLSHNVIGTNAANALAEYLRDKKCTIRILSLKAANVDDGECHKFVEALGENRVLEELDMSENLLGKDENLNAVKPDIVTAGESLGILLHDCRCPVKKLKVAWNMIRMEGAIELCRSLQYQRYLKHIDISFNSLGRESGVVLGNALLDNVVLEELIIANNNIDAIACFAICVGVREGRSIRYLNIDGNPIGEPGGRILMTLPVSCGSRVQFSAKNCDVTLRQDACWFNKSAPLGAYELDMTNGYELAIMYELLDIVANHPSYQFVDVQFGDSRDTKTWEPIIFISMEEKVESLSSNQKKLLESLHTNLKLAKDVDTCVSFFEMVAGDAGGDLNEQQFYELLDRIGFILEDNKKASIMSICDTDHSGEVQIEEFMEFLSEIARDTKLRIRDIETVSRCALESSPTERYIPPRLGVFRVTVGDSYTFGDSSRALTAEQVQNLLAMAKNTSAGAQLLQYAAQANLLRMDEAQELYNNIVTDNGDPAGTLAILLPHMAVSTDAQNLATVCAPEDDTVRKRIKNQLGPAYRAIMGIPNGYYALDLSKESDRSCMTKLLELSTTCAARRMQLGCGDVSQDGNWSSFRNEYFAGREIRLTLAALTPMPTQGKIEFDFVTSDRPSANAVCLTDRKIVQMLCHCKLLLPKHVHWAYDELSDMRAATMKSLASPGSMPYYERGVGRMIEAQNYKYNNLYSKLDQRGEQTERAVKKEQLQMLVRMPTRINSMPADFTSETMDLFNEFEPDEFGTSLLLDEGSSINTDINRGESTVQHTLETMHSVNLSDGREQIDGALSSLTSTTDGKRKKGKKDGNSKQIAYENGPQACASCSKMVDALEAAFASKYIYCRHLALIARAFRSGTLKKTDFGTYRVEVIVSLYPRVKDTHNFDLVLACVTFEEHGMLMARLGILNIIDPIRPEGGYCLDLSVWEERQVVKMMVHLAAVEPGVNWLSQSFQFDRTTKRIPGWELPVTWYTEAGLPMKGVISFYYYSGDGLRNSGCNPVMKDREALMSLVLHRPDLVTIDENAFTPLQRGSGHINIRSVTELLGKCGPPEIEWNYAPLKQFHE